MMIAMRPAGAPTGFDCLDPVPLSAEDFDDYGGGVTYVGPAGPENGRAARVAAAVDALRRLAGATKR